jgi:hypothetical protein
MSVAVAMTIISLVRFCSRPWRWCRRCWWLAEDSGAAAAGRLLLGTSLFSAAADAITSHRYY